VNVIGYTRVSTEEQAASGAGLAAQRAAILSEAERRGWHVLAIIEDAGFSARDMERPGIIAALDALRRKRADTLVVAKLDRLSRSVRDFAELMNRATKQHWALVALDMNVDTTTAAGEAMANVLATFAQFERRLIGERTRAAMAAKKAQGARFGRERQVRPDVVTRIIAKRNAGRSLRGIAADLDAEGVPTVAGGAWRASTIQRILAGEKAGEND
jgi:DNA invertase Pin-like site-specific DNA recombinase